MPSVLPPTEFDFLPQPLAPSVAPPHGKSHSGFMQRLANWRFTQLLQRALRQAGEPNLVLDLPCGNGQFWPLLTGHPNRVILAADNSALMLAQAKLFQPQAVIDRVRLFQTSVFSIDLPKNSVECIFCMRLFPRLDESSQRLAMLAEMHRVASDTLILATGMGQQQSNGLIVPLALIEAEFKQAGFSIAGHHDLLPGYSKRRIYVLRKGL